MGAKFLAGMKQKLPFLANQSQQKEDVEVENNQINFRVGSEYDIQQLTMYYTSAETLQRILDGYVQIINQKGLSEEEIKSQTSKVKNLIKKTLDTEQHFIENLQSKLKLYQKEFNLEVIENNYQDRADFEKNKILLELSIRKDLKRLPKRQKDLDNLKNKIEAFTELEETETPSIKGLLNYMPLYALVLGGVSFSDGILSFQSFIQVGDGVQNGAILWLIVMLSIGVGISGHLAGEGFANKKKFRILFWLATGVSILFLAVLIWVRADTQSSIVLSVLNVAFWGVAMLLSYKRNLTQPYWNFEKLKKQYHCLYAEVQCLQKIKSHETEAITIKMKHYAHEAALRDTVYNAQRLVELDNAHLGITKILLGYSSQIQTIEEIALTKRQRKERAKNWLTRPFSNLASNVRALFLSVSFVLFVTGCTTKDIQESHISIIIDLTEQEQALPDPQMLRDIVGDIEAGEIVFDMITDRYANVYRSIELVKPSPYWQRINEAEVLRKTDFDSLFYSTYKSLNIPIDEPTQSRVFATLSDNMIRLSKSNAKDKRMLIFSDLLQFEKGGINLYKYKKHPKRLMQDYSKIMSSFKSEHGPLKKIDLRGVKIIVYNLPKIENDALHKYVKQLYTKMWKEEYNVENIQFLPFNMQDKAIVQTH